MTGIIIYKSKYGAVKKYAEWLSEATGNEAHDWTDKSYLEPVLEARKA